jgi:hypothetical protein
MHLLNLQSILKADFFIDCICNVNPGDDIFPFRNIDCLDNTIAGDDECRLTWNCSSKLWFLYPIVCVSFSPFFDQCTWYDRPILYNLCAIKAYNKQSINTGKTKKQVADIWIQIVTNNWKLRSNEQW